MKELTVWFTDEHANSARELTRIVAEGWPICLYRWNDKEYLPRGHNSVHPNCLEAGTNFLGFAQRYKARHRLRT